MESDFLKEKAILVGVNRQNIDIKEIEESLKELEKLAETADVEVLGHMIQSRQKINAATFIGKGKAFELKELCSNMEANLIIFDDELTGSQIRNIEEITGTKVIDRSVLILEIFARRAKTKEGKVQVELAQLRYRLPRLYGAGLTLSRQGAGIGTRGPGETQLETDRRHILERIRRLENELKNIKRHRQIVREGQKKKNIPIVSLVGYTNAGKSTLLNNLTGAGVFVEDKLFATLDTTTRIIKTSKYDILFVDTVGFIRKLPHHLVESFKSTLEEIEESDVILHVVDSSSEDIKKHIEIVNNILFDIKVLDKPIITVYNKIDISGDINNRINDCSTDSVEVSAKYNTGMKELIDKIICLIDNNMAEAKMLIPFKNSNILSMIHKKGKIIEEEYTSEGTVVKASLPKKLYLELERYILDGE